MGGQQITIARTEPPRIGAPADLAPWVGSHGARLRRYFASRAPADEVDDLVQEVFLRLQAVRPRGPIGDMERYPFTVARHALASRERALAVRCSELHDRLDDVAEPASDLSPERIVSARQDYARAVAAVSDLPPRARAAFQLSRFEELSDAAIAEHMTISRGSVKELLNRAATRVCGSRGGAATPLAKSSRPHPPSRQSGASLRTGGYIAPPTGASLATQPWKEMS